MNTIDLRKKQVAKIAKDKNISGTQKAQVVLALDFSGSFEPLYRNGFVQRVIERLVPVAMHFDDNGEMEFYLFESSCRKHKNNVTSSNVDGIINREILSKYSFGGTQYAPAINAIVEDYIPGAHSTSLIKEKKKSMFGSLFGGKKDADVMESPATVKIKDPVYVLFITDGENSDHELSEEAIKNASKYGIFFQFVGLGNATMSFLDRLDTMEGRFIDNANFFQLNDIDKVSDEELYDRLLNEFPSWIGLAKNKGLIS